VTRPNLAPHRKGQRVRPEEQRHRAARLQRAGRRVCPACGHPLYSSSSSMHPQCAVSREEIEP
jgi:hypothetical protein